MSIWTPPTAERLGALILRPRSVRCWISGSPSWPSVATIPGAQSSVRKLIGVRYRQALAESMMESDDGSGIVDNTERALLPQHPVPDDRRRHRADPADRGRRAAPGPAALKFSAVYAVRSGDDRFAQRRFGLGQGAATVQQHELQVAEIR